MNEDRLSCQYEAAKAFPKCVRRFYCLCLKLEIT